MNFWPGYSRAVPIGCGLALALVSYSLQASAQEKPAESATVAEQQGDYSKGFALLRQMGLPDSSKATYGNLRGGDTRLGVSPDRESWDSIARQHNLKGNAWGLGEAGGNQEVIAENLRLIPLNSPGKGTSPSDQEFPNPYPIQFSALKPSELAEDAKRMLQGLKSKNDLRSGHYGQILLFSAHLASHGLTKEANQIAGRLFALADDPAIILGEAINSLADSKYEEAVDRLLASKSTPADWQAFEKELQKVIAQFGADWKLAPAVQRVALEAKKRSGKPPSIAGLSADDRKLADELAEAMWTGSRGYDFGIWVIKNEPTKVPALDRIRDRGLGTFPLLVSLLKDDYPTRTDHRALRGMGGGDFFEFGSGNDSPEEARKKAYDHMRRPASRGEIAACLLNQALPSGDTENGMPRAFPPDQLPEEALKFYKANKDKTPAQLALLYLKNGNRFQTQLASSYVLQEKSEENLAAVEAFLMDDPVEHFDQSMLRELLKAREKNGAAFLEKYRKAIESGKKTDPGAYYPGREQQVIERIKEILEEIKEVQDGISGKTAAQIAEEVLGGKRAWKSAKRVFEGALSREVPEKRIELVLDITLSQKEVMEKMEILGMLVSGRAEGPAPYGAAPALDPKRFKDKWSKLLADHTQLDPEMADSAGVETIGGASALMIELVYGSGNAMEQLFPSPFVALGEKIEGIWRTRAEARLAGKAEADIPKLPSASEVSAERKQELSTKLASAKPGELPAILATVTDSEILALAEETSFNANLLPIAHQVKSLKLEGFGADSAKKAEKWKGKPLDNELIDTVEGLEIGRAHV